MSSLNATRTRAGIIIERVIIDRPTPPPRRPRTGRVRLKAHDVSIRIENQAAVTEVKQVFYNPNRWPVEGVYLFPLPDGASVSAFTMKMGNKQITGEILDARRASDVYRSIVERRDDPGLLEYAGRRLIRARMFPIPAQATTDITLRYEQLLDEYRWNVSAVARHLDVSRGALRHRLRKHGLL